MVILSEWLQFDFLVGEKAPRVSKGEAAAHKAWIAGDN
jgi:hypothetical protein